MTHGEFAREFKFTRELVRIVIVTLLRLLLLLLLHEHKVPQQETALPTDLRILLLAQLNLRGS